jgi:hypothetical protein
MRATCRALVDVPAETVLAVLRDVPGWSTWLAPCEARSRSEGGWEVAFDLSSPRPHHLAGDVAAIEHGVVCAVRGELGAAKVVCTVVDANPGETSIVAELAASSDALIPGAWWSELGSELLPRWVRALRERLGASDRAGTGPSAG